MTINNEIHYLSANVKYPLAHGSTNLWNIPVCIYWLINLRRGTYILGIYIFRGEMFKIKK